MTRAVKIQHYCRVVSVCAAIVATLVSCSYLPDAQPDDRTIAAAQDSVYEAVVRDMTTGARGDSRVSQLVFSDVLLNELKNGEDEAACRKAVRKREHWQADAPPYDSMFDKIYRFVTNSRLDSSARTETVEDFLEKSCESGHLSRTFHTDLPKSFIASDDVWFDIQPAGKTATLSFEEMFPGASGVISFSRVGFNSSLEEAVVSASFVCGGLCGEGWYYILRKRRGKWEVAAKRMIWVS